jgi:acetyltransferase
MTIEKTGNEGWDALFYPSSIAVVGASPDPNKPGGIVLDSLRRGGYAGAVYPVNPKHGELEGWQCYPDLDSAPGPVDLAVIVVKSPQVLQTLKDCAAKKIPAVIIFSSGFGEVDEIGLELQNEIRELAKSLNIRVCGPNTMGIINYLHNMQAAFVFDYTLPSWSGNSGAGLGLICQSGGIGCSMLQAFSDYGLKVSMYVCTGNEAATDFSDYVNYFVRHPRVNAVTAYMEGVRDGKKLREAAESALKAGKPLVVLKTALNEASARAARSHTGSLAGSALVYHSFFRQKGIIEVDNLREMVAVLNLLAAGRLPEGNRVAVLASSGGHAVVAADKCASAGLEVIELSRDTRQQIARLLPSFAGITNPVDFTGQDIVVPGLLHRCSCIVAGDPDVDTLLLSHWLTKGVDSISQLKSIAADTNKPLVLVSTVPGRNPNNSMQDLLSSGVAFMGEVDTAAPALARVAQYSKKIKQYANDRAFKPGPPVPKELARFRSMGSGARLGEREVKELLAAYAIPVVPELPASTAAEAAAAAGRLGYPVAVKIDSPDIAHKTEVDGVRLNLSGPEDVRRAFAEITGEAGSRQPDALIRGVLVQKMLAGGLEILVGLSRDQAFGLTLTFGLGGIWVEIMKDISLRVIPVSENDIREMIAEIRAYPLLAGARGRPPADLEALTDAMLRVARLAEDWPELAELDINPLIVLPRGHGAYVVDALAVTAGAEINI